MIRVKYTGDDRRVFSWISMGKMESYAAGPGDILEIEDSKLPYLLSFGNFEAQIEGPIVESPPVSMDNNKISPFIKIVNNEEKTTQKEVPTVKEVKEPVQEPVQEVVPEVKAVEEVAPISEAPVIETPVEVPVIAPVEEVKPIVKEKKEKKIDYTSFKKKELVKMCLDRGLNTKGNRDDLITRLCANDQGITGL